MALSESSYLKQIEIEIEADGSARHVFAERVNVVERDGVEIARSTHRDSFTGDELNGQTVLSEALSSALLGAEVANSKLDQANTTINSLRAYITELEAKIAALEGGV